MCIYIYTHIRTYICMCIYIYIYVYAYMYIRLHMYKGRHRLRYVAKFGRRQTDWSVLQHAACLALRTASAPTLRRK